MAVANRLRSFTGDLQTPFETFTLERNLEQMDALITRLRHQHNILHHKHDMLHAEYDLDAKVRQKFLNASICKRNGFAEAL